MKKSVSTTYCKKNLFKENVMDEQTLAGIGVIVLIIVGLCAVMYYFMVGEEPGNTLQKKFISLGVLSGKTRTQITSVVGEPNSISGLGDGRSILQWMQTNYHIALIFNGDICEGVNHECKV
jgi:hypothetical protein